MEISRRYVPETIALETTFLLSEEVDSATGELLGNFPQAFSHIGLVTAAWAIAQIEAADWRVRTRMWRRLLRR